MLRCKHCGGNLCVMDLDARDRPEVRCLACGRPPTPPRPPEEPESSHAATYALTRHIANARAYWATQDGQP